METKQTAFLSLMSLLSIGLTILLASVTHFYEFGYRAFVVGGVIMGILSLTVFLIGRTKKMVFLVIYGFFNTLVIIGFGLVNGFWNHGFKVFLFYLHNGALPPMLSKLFLSPQIGSLRQESIGVLTFVASLFAAYFTFQYIRQLAQEGNNEELR